MINNIMFRKDYSLKVLVIVIFLASLSVLTASILVIQSQTYLDFARLHPDGQVGDFQRIDDRYRAIGLESGTPRAIKNYSNKDLFIPLRTKGEWDSFFAAMTWPDVDKWLGVCGDGGCVVNFDVAGNSNIENCYNCSTDCGGCVCESSSSCPYGEYCGGLDYYCKDEGGASGAQCRYHSNQDDCEVEYGCEWKVRGVGTCTPGACYPSCVGKVCGDDGCGGSCGTNCAWNKYCSSGQCILKCGDGICTYPENPTSCITDCPHTCSDGYCTGSETCSSCPQDCGACGPACGNEYCESGEDCWSCSLDCGGCICDSPDECPSGESCFGFSATCRDYGGMGGCRGNTTRSSCENNPGCEWEVEYEGSCSF